MFAPRSPATQLPRGFYRLIAAQVTTGLADNALLIVAIGHLQLQGLPAWWAPVLKLSFTLSYVALAPWVGPWADRVPKARLLWQTGGLKALGVCALMGGWHPAIAFAWIGLGAALYAPAKYGWVTENVPAQRLVRANGWLEVSLVLAILLGVAGGGGLTAWAPQWPVALPGLPDTPLQAAWLALLALYLLAAVLGRAVPLGRGVSRPTTHWARTCVQAFWRDNCRLWRDPLGGLSMAATSLFWAAGATLQLAVLQWAQARLGLSLSHAAVLQASVAIGVMVGAAWAAKAVPLRRAASGLPVGIVLGGILVGASWLREWQWALPVMLGVGALSGIMVVPMNALLQYRGQRLLDAGRSIAIQGFNENAGILLAMLLYAASLEALPHVAWAMTALGIMLVLGTSALWWRARRVVRLPGSLGLRVRPNKLTARTRTATR